MGGMAEFGIQLCILSGHYSLLEKSNQLETSLFYFLTEKYQKFRVTFLNLNLQSLIILSLRAIWICLNMSILIGPTDQVAEYRGTLFLTNAEQFLGDRSKSDVSSCCKQYIPG